MAVSLLIRKDGSVVIPKAVLERAGMAAQPRIWASLGAGGLVLRAKPFEEIPEGLRPYRDEEEMDDTAKGYKF